MRRLYLYTTEGCHLCEQAESMLNRLTQASSYDWEAVEISVSDELIAQYGTRIPVVALEAGWGREVPRGASKEETLRKEPLRKEPLEKGWPFTYAELCDWLDRV